jgi:hypothetical protein
MSTERRRLLGATVEKAVRAHHRGNPHTRAVLRVPVDGQERRAVVWTNGHPQTLAEGASVAVLFHPEVSFLAAFVEERAVSARFARA